MNNNFNHPSNASWTPSPPPMGHGHFPQQGFMGQQSQGHHMDPFSAMQQTGNPQMALPMPQPPQYFADLWMGRIDKHGIVVFFFVI